MAIEKDDNRVIHTNQELAYLLVDTMNVIVLEMLMPQDNTKSRFYIVNTFNRKDVDNPNSYMSGYDITDFFMPNRLHKPASVIRQELYRYIKEYEARTLEFSDHFPWIIYR